VVDSWDWKNHELRSGIHEWQLLVAYQSEAEIEALEPDGATVRALRWIDTMQAVGVLEHEIAVLRKTLKRLSLRKPEGFPAYGNKDFLPGWTYLFEGCRSPDAAERDRYRRARRWLRERFGDSPPSAVAPVIAIIAPPKRSAGRPRKTGPSVSDCERLARMKTLVLQGMKPSAAAREIASGGPAHAAEAARKRLERWWRWKVARREFPPELGT
jgi:hypothetical protein